VVTADATGTQTTTAAHITGRGGHYVLTVKGNQASLRARCTALPWAKIRATSAVDRGHGRRVRRTIKVAAAPVLLDFSGAVQVAQIRHTRTVAGKKSVEVVYVITSMTSTQASLSRSPPRSRGTGQSRTGCTGSVDVVFDEDRSSVRTGHAPRVMATLRSTAISVLRLTGETSIAPATRHHARNPHRPVQLLLTR
jgi:predicted transposase YbfD/YdcC